jgi:hypothetical protein
LSPDGFTKEQVALVLAVVAFQSFGEIMRKLYIAGVAVAALAVIGIASCSHHNDEYAQQPAPVQTVAAVPAGTAAPVYVQQPPVVVQQAPSNDGFFTGMLMGHLMSGGGHTTVVHHYTPAPVVHNTTVVNKTVVNKTVNVTRPAPAPVYRAPVSTYRASSGYSAYRSSGYSSFRAGRR